MQAALGGVGSLATPECSIAVALEALECTQSQTTHSIIVDCSPGHLKMYSLFNGFCGRSVL
jgi:hypothetical protein